jgi:guanine deaminase
VKGGADCAVRGAFFDFVDDPWRHPDNESAAARFHADGLLVVRGGHVADFGPYEEVSARNPGIEVTHVPDRIILPGFIDGHIHFPQVRVLGAYGHQLLDWLLTWIFPEEEKYADPEYAREAATHFFKALLAGGTTTCQAFTTSSPVSTEVFFEAAAERGMRVIAGLTGIDKFAPPDTVISPDDFYHQSKDLIARFHGKGRNLYAITPRFAVGCTEQMMERCQQLREEHPDVWVNTHISENPSEIATAKASFPDCPDYTAVQEKYGLLGPRFTAGHGVWLSNDEFRRFSESGASICFCPLSNLFLGSGLFRLGKAKDPDQPVRLSIGCDMGGGNAFTLIRVLEEAYKVGMCNNTMLDGSVSARDMDSAEAARNKLSPYRAFYLATLGGAHALYLDHLIGNFDVGKEADFVVLDYCAGQDAVAWHQSLTASKPSTMTEAADLLFGVLALGDDRNIDETWVAGRRVHKRQPR